MGKIEIFKGKDDQFYYKVVAENGETLVVSEGFTTKQNAFKSIDSLKENINSPVFWGEIEIDESVKDEKKYDVYQKTVTLPKSMPEESKKTVLKNELGMELGKGLGLGKGLCNGLGSKNRRMNRNK